LGASFCVIARDECDCCGGVAMLDQADVDVRERLKEQLFGESS
jgi:hypothetical protein